MTREEKTAAIAELSEELGNHSFFYLADASTMSVAKINKFRRMCFEKGIRVKAAKNTLIQKALEGMAEDKGFQPLFETLKGATTILFSENPKAPAKLLEEFRKTEDRPILKAAYIDTAVYIGDDQIKVLTQIKSKDEMIGEIIGLLQSPAKRISSQITATGSRIAGIIQALEERS